MKIILNGAPRDVTATRLSDVMEELGYAGRCDAVVVNDDLDVATAQTLDLVRTFIET